MMTDEGKHRGRRLDLILTYENLIWRICKIDQQENEFHHKTEFGPIPNILINALVQGLDIHLHNINKENKLYELNYKHNFF